MIFTLQYPHASFVGANFQCEVQKIFQPGTITFSSRVLAHLWLFLAYDRKLPEITMAAANETVMDCLDPQV